MAPVLEFITGSVALLTQFEVPKGISKTVTEKVRSNLLESAAARYAHCCLLLKSYGTLTSIAVGSWARQLKP